MASPLSVRTPPAIRALPGEFSCHWVRSFIISIPFCMADDCAGATLQRLHKQALTEERDQSGVFEDFRGRLDKLNVTSWEEQVAAYERDPKSVPDPYFRVIDGMFIIHHVAPQINTHHPIRYDRSRSSSGARTRRQRGSRAGRNLAP